MFLIKKSDGDSRFCSPEIDANSSWNDENLYSNEYENIHELPIPYIVENDYEPDDYLVCSNIVVSGKFLDIIKQLNKEITIFESQMYLNGNKIWEMYYTLVLPKYSLLNRAKSIFEERQSSFTGQYYIRKIEKLVFDAAKIGTMSNCFFTMEELPTRFYCNERGKQAIEAAGLIGIAFEEIPAE